MTVPAPAAANARKPDWLSVTVTLLLLVWMIGQTLVIQLGAVVSATVPEQIFPNTGITAPQIYFGAAVAQGIALLLPLLPLALLWRAPRYKAAYRTWLAAACFLLLLAPARLVSSTQPQLTMLLQLILALAFSLGVWWLTGRGQILQAASSGALALAVASGTLLLVPWLAYGALGSVGDVILGILTSFAVALAATMTTARLWLRQVGAEPHGAFRDTALGGIVVGAMLLIMGSAVGFGGTQVLFMLALSAFGWLVIGLARVNFDARATWNDSAVLVLLTFAVGAPMLFLDPDAGVLLASAAPGDVLGYAVRATALVAVGALALGLLIFLLRNPIARLRRAAPLWLGAAALGIVALGFYFVAGQPGFFGDRVFVIMKEQADVSSARNIVDYGERRAVVYETLTNHAGLTQANLKRTLDTFSISYTPYYLVNALEVSADLPVQWWLETRGDVDRVLPSPVMRPLPEPPQISEGGERNAPTAPNWNLTLIGADQVWNELGVRGAGVLIGQSDSGVDGSHPELAAQYRGRGGDNDMNWFDPWNHTSGPTDIGGHGTHTLGSILGKTVGVAPDAEWIACVNLARNLGNPALYLDCMQFMLAPFPQHGDPLLDGDPKVGAQITNNSWGCPDVEGCDPNTLLPAVRALRDAGVFVVASAGNDGPGCSTIDHPLSLYDDVFSVGAVDSGGRLADFSSRGPVESDGSGRVKPDIAAPGVNVYSSLPNGTYGENSGTSMAGPHVVGVVALMWSANPALIGDIERTEQILRETAKRAKVTPEGIVCGDPNAVPNDLTGYGIVDAYASVKRALAEK